LVENDTKTPRFPVGERLVNDVFAFATVAPFGNVFRPPAFAGT
jgi:hypothetical protein